MTVEQSNFRKINDKFSIDTDFDRSPLFQEYVKTASYRCRRQGIIMWLIVGLAVAAGMYGLFLLNGPEYLISYLVLVFAIFSLGLAVFNLIALITRRGPAWFLLKDKYARDFLLTLGITSKQKLEMRDPIVSVDVEIVPEDDSIELRQGSFNVKYKISQACWIAKTENLLLVGFCPTMRAPNKRFSMYHPSYDPVGTKDAATTFLETDKWKIVPMKRNTFSNATEEEVIAMFKKHTAKNTWGHLFD